jgi:hypothetical protein
MKFLNDRVPPCPLLETWDFGQILLPAFYVVLDVRKLNKITKWPCNATLPY